MRARGVAVMGLLVMACRVWSSNSIYCLMLPRHRSLGPNRARGRARLRIVEARSGRAWERERKGVEPSGPAVCGPNRDPVTTETAACRHLIPNAAPDWMKGSRRGSQRAVGEWRRLGGVARAGHPSCWRGIGNRGRAWPHPGAASLKEAGRLGVPRFDAPHAGRKTAVPKRAALTQQAACCLGGAALVLSLTGAHAAADPASGRQGGSVQVPCDTAP